MKFVHKGSGSNHGSGKIHYSKSHFMSEKKKREEETKRHEKAAALRKYAKLCAKEGIVSSRVNMKNIPNAPVQPEKVVVSEKSVKPKKEAQRVSDEVNPLKEREDREKQQREAIERRNEKRRAMMQKTKKGQPVMKNQITSILSKLMAEKS